MNLDPAQQSKVAAWIEEGLKLSEIQKRLESELGLRMTYLEVRLLVDDLKLKPKDPPPPRPSAPSAALEEEMEPEPPLPPGAASSVSISIDQVTRPGAYASGKVRFSDGKTADWFFDHAGRLGVIPSEKGYKPAPADLQEFQAVLQSELQKLGI